MKISVLLEMLTANFETDAKRAEKTLQKSVGAMQARMRNFSNSMTGDLKRIGSTLAAGFSVVALTSFVKGTIDAADKLNDLKKQTGISVASLSTLDFAAKQSGTSLSGLAKGMQKLAMDAADGGEKLRRAGINATDMQGRFKSVDTLLSEVADKFASMSDGVEKAAYAQELFGKSGKDLIPFLNQGAAGIDALREQARRLGLQLSDETAEAADQLNDNLQAMKDSLTGVGNDILKTALPAMIQLTESFVTFMEAARADGSLQAFMESMTTLVGLMDDLSVFIITRMIAGSLIPMGLAFVTAAGKVGVATASLNAFRVALALAGGPIGILITAVAAVAVAVYNYESSADKATEAVDSLKSAQDRLNNATGPAIAGAMAMAEAEQDRAAATLKAAQADLAAARAIAMRLSSGSDPLVTAIGASSPGAAALAMAGAAAGARLAEAEVVKLDAAIALLTTQMAENEATIGKNKERLKEYMAALTGADKPARQLGATQKELNADQKASDEILRKAAEAQKEWNEAVTAAAEAAADASEGLSNMLDNQAATLGGPSVTAALNYRDALVAIYEWEGKLMALGPISLVEQAKLDQARRQAGFVFRKELDENDEALQKSIAKTKEWADYWENDADRVLGTLGDLFSGGLDGLDDFGEAMIARSRQIASDMMAEFMRTGEWEFKPGMFGEGGTGSSVGGWAGAIGSAYGGWQNAQNGGSTLSTIAGFASAGNDIAGGWGAVVGAIVGAIVAITSKDESLLRVRSQEFTGPRRSEGRTTSDLGEIFIRTEHLGGEDEAPTSPEIAQRLREFDNLIAGLLNEEQLESVRAAMRNVNDTFEGEAATIEAALESRFSSIIGALDENVQHFVGSVGPLEERIARLADALSTQELAQRDMDSGRGLLGAEGTLTDIFELVTDLKNPGEALAAAYVRVATASALLNDAMDLSGVNLDLSAEAFVRFATDIVEAAGGLERAQALWSDYFQMFYTETERLGLAMERATANADSQFADIGLNASDFTGAGGGAAFREMFENILPTLSAEAVVQWLEAANSLGLLVEATEAYNAALSGTDVAEGPTGVLDGLSEGLGEFMQDIRDQIEEFSPPDFAERIASVNERIQKLINQAEEMNASEEQLAEIRALGLLQVNEILAEQTAFIQEQAAAMAEQLEAARSLREMVMMFEAEATGGITPLTEELMNLNSQYAENVSQMNELAIAAGRTGASTEELAAATSLYRAQLRALIGEYYAAGQSIVSQLYGSSGGSSSNSSSGASSGGGGGGGGGGDDTLNQAIDDRYQRELDYLRRIRDFLDSLNLSELSPLTPAERLADAQNTYQSLLARAQSGDLDALEQLQEAAQNYLREAQSFTGGVGGYSAIFEGVRDALAALTPQQPVPEPNAGGGGGGGGGSNVVEAGESFAELSELERRALAGELAAIIRDLIGAREGTLDEIAERLGVDLRLFVADLGVDLNDLTVATGVNLANIARNLGVELTELSTSVGVDLGSLANEQSLMNDSLELVIAGLPGDIQGQLRGLLADIEDSVDDADANAAIGRAEDAINDMAPEIRDLLAPFFDGVSSPTDSLLSVTISQAGDIAAIRGLLEDPPDPPSPGPFGPVGSLGGNGPPLGPFPPVTPESVVAEFIDTLMASAEDEAPAADEVTLGDVLGEIRRGNRMNDEMMKSQQFVLDNIHTAVRPGPNKRNN